MIRPTCILNIDVDESIYDEENTPVELRRSYLYIAPLRVNKKPTPEPPYPPENIMGVTIKLRNHPYWVSSSDPLADEMWTEVMKPWLDAKLLKIENTVIAYNRRKKEDGEPLMDYGHLELKMDGYTLSFKSYSNDEFADVFTLADRFRTLLNTGCMKGMENDIVRVEFPWQDPEVLQAAWDAAHEAELAAQAEAEAAAKAEAEAAAAAAEAAEEGEQIPLGEDGDYDDSDFAGAPLKDLDDDEDEEEEEEEFDVIEEDYEEEDEEYIDYSIWEVTFADGTKRRLDSTDGIWMD